MAGGDTAHIRQLLIALLAAYNAGDAEKITECILPDWSVFGGRDQFVPGGDRERLQAAFASGFRTDLHWRHLYVRLYGRIAIATGYLGGQVHMPDGRVLEDTWKFYKVWLKKEGKWCMASDDELPPASPPLLPTSGDRQEIT